MDITDSDFCEKFKGKKIKVVGNGFMDTPESIYGERTELFVTGEYKEVKVKGKTGIYKVWKETK